MSLRYRDRGADGGSGGAGASGSPGKRTLTQSLPVQSKASAPSAADDARGEIPQVAAEAVSGSGGSLPYLDEIQRSFGHHDVGDVRAHTDGAAAAGARALGAEAFATGADVAFAGPPNLFTAAHEA